MVGGTTAKLNVGDVFTVIDLIYGMMLPSGNDAAIAIS
jgi:D-alanyl-D-alanine carboxypeptidase